MLTDQQSTTQQGQSQQGTTRMDLRSPDLYLNRELSWLAFNERVLAQVADRRHPLLERVKFLAIFHSNLDEFFMVRVSGLRRQLSAGVVEAPADGLSPADQLTAIRSEVDEQLGVSCGLWRELHRELADAQIEIVAHSSLDPEVQRQLRKRFKSEIFPVLTPLAVDPGHPFPHISNLSVNLGVTVEDTEGASRFARIKVPQTLPRLIPVPEVGLDEQLALGVEDTAGHRFVWLEDLILANVDRLFPGLEVTSGFTFRVTRDADQEIDEDEAGDLLTAMAEIVEQRHFGHAVRLEVSEGVPDGIRSMLRDELGLAPFQVYESDAPLGLSSLWQIASLDRRELRDRPFHPRIQPVLQSEASIFEILDQHGPLMVHHPYDSFAPVVRLLEEAATDPNVVAIKQTLYRTGQDSPIVAALMKARQNDKQVSALVELKARFDESSNIGWAKALEHAGVHVVYGLVGLKTHAKMTLVVRRENGKVRRYVHVGTGNYNPVTAQIYTDLGMMSTDPAIGKDLADLFNSLTGYSAKTDYRKVIVAPHSMRRELISRIERETEHRKQGRPARLMFKMNSLVDPQCIRALYRASQAGVESDLVVRGICCLRPGVPGVSDNIRVVSLIGRFLEHSRIYCFANGGEPEVLIGSADIMPRNLDNRVELIAPVEDEKLQRSMTDLLGLQLADTANAWELGVDGQYQRIEPSGDVFDSQYHLIEHSGSWWADA